MTPIEVIRQAQGMKLQDRKGHVTELELLPPLTDEEMRALESSLPCPLPDEARELFAYSRGFKGALGDTVVGEYEGVDFSGIGSDWHIIEEIFPNAIPVVRDWPGNCWIVDLTSESTSWGPIFYSCHDAPVIVFQTHSLAHFITEVLRLGNPPWESEIVTAENEQIWGSDPGVMTHEQCLQSGDAELEAFARSLDETWQFVDLRHPRLGDGFSWGRYGGPETLRRYGEKRIFAYQQRTSLWQRLRGR
jgi:hypothetical protein